MNLLRAVSLVEGDAEAESEEEVISAWQYLHDSGAAYSLQGWYGRTAIYLLQRGVIRGQ